VGGVFGFSVSPITNHLLVTGDPFMSIYDCQVNTNTNNNLSNNTQNTNVGTIVAAIIVPIIILFALSGILFAFFIYRRRKQRLEEEEKKIQKGTVVGNFIENPQGVR
jgi:hypothetical protein